MPSNQRPSYGPGYRWTADNLDQVQTLVEAQIRWLDEFAAELREAIGKLEERTAALESAKRERDGTKRAK